MLQFLIQYHTRLHKWVFFSLILFYSAFYARFGMDDTDGGYVIGLAWRIINGELPYKDFICVRPPVFIYLHTLSQVLIPENYVFLFERILFYVFIAVYSYLSSSILNKFFDFKILGLEKYLLASISFVFCAHNFPPMPWHTVDGIFLSVIGLYFLLGMKDTSVNIVLGILFLLLSALCKQSFYLMPFAAVIFTFLTRSSGKGFLALLSFSLGLLGFLFVMKTANIWPDFIFWTTGASRFKDLIFSGFITYIDLSFYFFILTVFIHLGIRKYFEMRNKVFNHAWAVVILFSLVFIYSVAKVLYTKEYLYPPGDYPKVFFLISLAVAIYSYRKKEEKMLVLGLMLLLSWCCSISWGYLMPIFYSTPIVFGLIYLANHLFDFPYKIYLNNYILIGAFAVFFVSNQFSYRDGVRSELNYSLGDIFPRLSGIKTDKQSFDKYTELKQLINEYGSNFKTLPSMPLSNYISKTRSPLQLDWVVAVESNYRDSLLILQLNQKKPVVFLEKIEIEDPENYTTLFYVKNNWNKIKETGSFEVYTKP